MSTELTLTVHPFRMGSDKEAALKPLEEAAEVFGAWQKYDLWYRLVREETGLHNLSDELADVIQAACNLADRYGIDLQAALERCEQKNRERGRYDDGEVDE